MLNYNYFAKSNSEYLYTESTRTECNVVLFAELFIETNKNKQNKELYNQNKWKCKIDKNHTNKTTTKNVFYSKCVTVHTLQVMSQLKFNF